MISSKVSYDWSLVTFEKDPDPKLDPDLGVYPDPRWIRIRVRGGSGSMQFQFRLGVIPDPDPDLAKNGIVTPLGVTH